MASTPPPPSKLSARPWLQWQFRGKRPILQGWVGQGEGAASSVYTARLLQSRGVEVSYRSIIRSTPHNNIAYVLYGDDCRMLLLVTRRPICGFPPCQYCTDY